MSRTTYGGKASPPERFAVVEVGTREVIMRALRESEANVFAEQWSKRHGETVAVLEPVSWPTDDQVLEQLQLAR